MLRCIDIQNDLGLRQLIPGDMGLDRASWLAGTCWVISVPNDSISQCVDQDWSQWLNICVVESQDACPIFPLATCLYKVALILHTLWNCDI